MLKLSNVEVVYNDVILVLRGLSIEVPDGKIIALLGANGAGKTTTLRTLTGLLDVHSGVITKGHVTYQDTELNDKKPSDIVLQGISQVMEGRRVFSELTVDENLACGGITVKDKGAVAASYGRVMDLFPRLAERRTQLAGYLSGGEQQMLAIGRALMGDPDLLMLDEPTLGLAPVIIQDIDEAIERLRSEGLTIFLAEQNSTFALRHAERLSLLETGEVELSGDAEEFQDNEYIREAYIGVH